MNRRFIRIQFRMWKFHSGWIECISVKVRSYYIQLYIFTKGFVTNITIVTKLFAVTRTSWHPCHEVWFCHDLSCHDLTRICHDLRICHEVTTRHELTCHEHPSSLFYQVKYTREWNISLNLQTIFRLSHYSTASIGDRL